ncbi:hypothetical protein SSP24_79120 [Streptomyces spinoverrucosus]|uniref:SH3 domain-containing protein n=1 Tax=Streptomyces spinoverrucosus TaxID=284043 RepID=A0A4Y3VTT0_9ACTN|nr:hypothetical protein [Streptomyces spinoverrucosus]GEC10257.1 hypothetical protein SSP24_79120 [Streptomyces spinoverrucosus]GHB97927.1 hypothetical protein GCM10010397_83100 [Streptomyces spinoverrucosus]
MLKKISRRSRYTALAGGACAAAVGASLLGAGPALAAPGASAPSPAYGTVDTAAAQLLVRSTPKEVAENVGALPSHTKAGLECKIDNGKEIDRDGTKSTVWYKLDTSRTDGKEEVVGWTSGAYMKVHDGADIPQCPAMAAQQEVPAGAKTTVGG